MNKAAAAQRVYDLLFMCKVYEVMCALYQRLDAHAALEDSNKLREAALIEARILVMEYRL